MAKGKSIQLTGDKELIDLLNQFPNRARDKAFWRSTARAVSNPIVKRVRKKVPIDRGDLKRSVKYRNFSNEVYQGMGGYVKFDHWSNSETMTNPAKADILVHNRKVKPLKKTYKNFITEASDEVEDQSMQIMIKRTDKFFQRELKKLSK